MKGLIEKILERLEEDARFYNSASDVDQNIRSGLIIAKEAVQEVAEKYNNGWIQVDEELPKDGDNRYYMCIVENHEEDPPMCCQYDEECGFGFYQDIYDEHTLGFVDCVFQTNEELGYEKVIAWQPLPQPYQPKGE